MIKHWLRNSPDPSWTTLANAVERMRYTELAETLRKKEQSEKSALKKKEPCEESDDESITIALDKCEEHSILLLGRRDNGKSKLRSIIVDSERSFPTNNQNYPQIYESSAVYISKSHCKNFMVKVYDHSGLFEGARLINNLARDIPRFLNLVVFVLKRGSSFDANQMEILHSIVHEWQISQISALVLTHCEHLSEEERREMIEQFKKDHPSIAKLMGKGILTVGFPDSSCVPKELRQRVEMDIKKLRLLISSCDERVLIPQRQNRCCSVS